MFKFDFGGQDPADDSEKIENSEEASLVPPQLLSLELLGDRAPRISYTKDRFGIPRRDLFDVRFELMSADEISEDEKMLLSGTEDVRKTVYEGGLKVWEGTNDLLDVLVDTKPSNLNACLELGCGAGLPICYLFHTAVASSKKGRFVLADYNAAVLTLLTMPNVVLSWLAATKNELVEENHGELVISSELIAKMLADLQQRHIELVFVAGGWSPAFSQIVGDAQYDLVLASETIYSLESIKDFTAVLQRALKPLAGVGLVAAKKVYFGVGGGIVEFQRLLDERGIRYETVYERGSVGRVVLQITVS